MASVRAHIWCQKQDVRRLHDTFEPSIRRAIFATWIILPSVQAQPSIPDPLLHGWKMAEGGVDAVVSSCKEASSLEAYCRCKSGRCRKDCSCSKMKGCCSLCSYRGTRSACRGLTLPHLSFRKKKMINIFESFIWSLLLLVATGP